MNKKTLGYIIYKVRLALVIFKAENYIVITDNKSFGHQQTPAIAEAMIDELENSKDRLKEYLHNFYKPSNFKYTGGKHE